MNTSGRHVISESLSQRTVKLKLLGRQRDDVLAELVACIPEIAYLPEVQQTLLRALQEREQLHSTGIGDGIALPHARNALVGLVEKPVIVFGRSDPGVAFGAIDGQPTKLFFLLVAPSVTTHLAILARLSRLLRQTKLREALLTADRPENIVKLISEAEHKTFE